jgi:hypothetical protein
MGTNEKTVNPLVYWMGTTELHPHFVVMYPITLNPIFLSPLYQGDLMLDL